MTMRFLLLRWRHPDERRALSAIARLPNLDVVFDTATATLIADRDVPRLDLGDRGVVLGVAFGLANGFRIEAFSREQLSDLLATDGAALLTMVWGAYVAVVHNDQTRGLSVLRDPSGAIPVYRFSADEVDVVTSDLGLAERVLGQRFEIDWTGVAQLLAYPQDCNRATGLQGVEEAPAGALLCWRGEGLRETQLWSPWTFAEPARQINDLAIARDQLRRILERVVSLWGRVYPDGLLELSGGLDSSIIGLCLPKTGRMSAINIATALADGDERDYARASAKASGLALEEVTVEPLADFNRTREGRFPRPAAHGYLQAVETTLADAGRRRDVQAFFSGKGGDNVLCDISTAGPGADALLAHGLGSAAFSTFADLARVHGCTVWTAAWLSAKKVFKRPRPRPAQTHLLRADLTVAQPDHPWRDGGKGIPPGKRDHVRSLLVAYAFLDRYAHAAAAPVIAPMLSQPMIELCLRIPTWMWVDGGQSRALARQAFATRLPNRVRQRTTKGSLDGYAAAIYRQSRSDLTRLLVDGRLANAGLLDGVALRAVLERQDHPTGVLTRIFQLADTEAWARTWD